MKYISRCGGVALIGFQTLLWTAPIHAMTAAEERAMAADLLAKTLNEADAACPAPPSIVAVVDDDGASELFQTRLCQLPAESAAMPVWALDLFDGYAKRIRALVQQYQKLVSPHELGKRIGKSMEKCIERATIS
jgi:hypothetical protein